MSFGSFDAVVSALSSGNKSEFNFYKTGGAPQAAGNWQSLWKAAGAPAAGADPGTARYNSNLAGSINWAAATPSQRFMVTFGGVASVNCSLMLYDRLADINGVSLSATGSKACALSAASVPRYVASAAQKSTIEAWVEVTTATTTTAPQIYIDSYTDEDGNAAQNATSSNLLVFPAAATVVGWMGKLPVLPADHGVSGIASIYVNTAAAAGVCNVMLMRPLCIIPLLANQWNERSLLVDLPALPDVYDGASLALAQFASATTATNVWGQIRCAIG